MGQFLRQSGMRWTRVLLMLAIAACLLLAVFASPQEQTPPPSESSATEKTQSTQPAPAQAAPNAAKPVIDFSDTEQHATPPAVAPAQTVAPAAAPRVPASPTTTPAPAPAKPAVVTPQKKLSRAFKVSGEQQWLDTGIDVRAGDHIQLSGQGSMQYEGTNAFGPEGLPRTWKDVLRALPVNSAGSGALIGRIGSVDTAVPFLIGPKKDFVAGSGGRLYLGINQMANDASAGTFAVKLDLDPAKTAASAVVAHVALPAGLFDRIPRRVSDNDKRPGDMVNLLVVGPQDKLEKAFAAAGWVHVDKTESEGVLNAILATTKNEAYVQMPMSELYLFGRAQDYGYARAEPVSVVATRHHLRIWRTNDALNGKPIWAVAATHDIGFERDQRNGGVTHKIDPNVDAEREFVGQTLDATGLVAALDHALPPDPVIDASTATGGSFHSDGRVLVLVLR